jgi:hypothetical protein
MPWKDTYSSVFIIVKESDHSGGLNGGWKELTVLVYLGTV